jgi:hypothetical protein
MRGKPPDETFLYLVEPQKLCSERLAGAARLALSRPKPQAPRTRAGAAQAQAAPGRPALFSNPIIPGFAPDPSIVHVGPVYYLVTSTRA